MSRRLPLLEVRPTQLYLSSRKLARVVEWFDFDEPAYGPLPAFERDGEWYLADGHTRAFVADLAGEERLSVEREEALREEHDFEVYLACIGWCADAGVETVRDLRGRVVGPDTYEECWIERCHDLDAHSGS